MSQIIIFFKKRLQIGTWKSISRNHRKSSLVLGVQTTLVRKMTYVYYNWLEIYNQKWLKYLAKYLILAATATTHKANESQSDKNSSTWSKEWSKIPQFRQQTYFRTRAFSISVLSKTIQNTEEYKELFLDYHKPSIRRMQKHKTMTASEHPLSHLEKALSHLKKCAVPKRSC